MSMDVLLLDDEVETRDQSRFELTIVRKAVEPEVLKNATMRRCVERFIHVLQTEQVSERPIRFVNVAERKNATFAVQVVRKNSVDPLAENLDGAGVLDHLLTIVRGAGRFGGPYRGHDIKPAARPPAPVSAPSAAGRPALPS